MPSRNSAMTTLPTEIIFDAEATEPVLHLSSEILSVFQETLIKLRSKIDKIGLQQAEEELAQYPHLVKMPKSRTISPLFKVIYTASPSSNVYKSGSSLRKSKLLPLCASTMMSRVEGSEASKNNFSSNKVRSSWERDNIICTRDSTSFVFIINNKVFFS